MDLWRALGGNKAGQLARQGVVIALRRRLPRILHPLLPGSGLTVADAVKREGIAAASSAVARASRGSRGSRAATVRRGLSPAVIVVAALVFVAVSVGLSALALAGAVIYAMLG